MALLEYDGDLLEAEVDVIAHQCNVMSRGVSGLARDVFTKHPKTNTHHENPSPEKYMTAEVFAVEGAPYKYVANVYAQFNPGHPAPNPNLDDAERRQIAFGSALGEALKFMLMNGLTSIAVPKNIGCDLAGGDWETYHQALVEVSEQLPMVDIHIVNKQK